MAVEVKASLLSTIFRLSFLFNYALHANHVATIIHKSNKLIFLEQQNNEVTSDAVNEN